MGGRHWLSLQMLLDSALPIGSFAHSYGLETLVQDGAITDGEGLRRYISGMLKHSWATSDLMVIKAVYAGDYANLEYAIKIEKLVHLQRISPESRDGIVKTGRRLLRLASELFPGASFEPVEAAVKVGRSYGTFPFVFGAVCREIGIPLERGAEGYLYSCVASCAGAALRLLPMGQNEAQRIISGTIPEIPAAWAAVRELDPSDAYGAMPMAELAMIRHGKLYSRLFMS
jgi:urease accessory protein